ncbi:Gfo/Idh/MocA family protein [Fimbriiglobus ruber]|uniref:Myo-inositol 2-dehydrogenase n=1 Tax=Fimbriiglobus ruber TaxID=1908690 RepID=A0A225E5D0_9BACT|nr:Gfo/Idh/MocA family oxidoreductase [Fimbriiglobus ruber]OWK46974.1 Myo-inositol 2-dehydrogenase [Fimbriiglobus ruber]
MSKRKAPNAVSRRGFLQASAAAAATGALVTPAVHAAGNDMLKIALVGCGGRGSGAAANALQADPNVKLVAACDIFPDRLHEGVKNLKTSYPDKVDVPEANQFTGFDGYKGAIDAADVVILATSPGFRPLHLAYAVEKGKHIFMEKPHAADATGVRSVIESAKLAQQKGLSLVSGFCYRYDPFKREAVKRIHDGQIGKVTTIHTTFLTGELWFRGQNKEWSEMEYQIRNWYYYTWLSGDFIVEQAIHNVDKAHWVMGELPVAATGMGGRQVRTDPKYGNIWDNFTVVYEYASGAKVFLQCRQTAGCYSDNNDHIIGTKGSGQLMKHTLTTDGVTWKHPGEHDFGKMYQIEHNEMFAGIRAGKPLNDGIESAYSTLMGIMGREAAYSGQRITWKQMLESKQNLMPKEFAWGANKVPSVAMPGKGYKFA